MTNHSTHEDTPTEEPTHASTPDRQTIIDHLEAAVIPLGWSGPRDDRSAIDALHDMFDNASIIGLGEATHGTRECFQCKHRLLRYLVSERDLRHIGFELTYAESIPIDRYIRSGTGKAETALGGISLWPWKTESVLDLLEWLRKFNIGRSAEDQIRFHGLDMQHAGPPSAELLAGIDEVAPSYPDAHRQTLRELAADGLLRGPDTPTMDRIDRSDKAVDELRDCISRERTAQLPERFWWCLRTLEQSITMAREQSNRGIESGSHIRDQAMAENALALLNRTGADRLAIWAHNAHLKRTSSTYDWGTSQPMGRHLSSDLGDRYLPVGFDIGSGTFRAIDGRGEGYDGLGTWSFDPPLKGSLTELLMEVEQPVFALDLRALAEDPVVGPWLSDERAYRWSGAVYYGSSDEHWTKDVLPEAFDVLVFVREGSATTPLG